MAAAANVIDSAMPSEITTAYDLHETLGTGHFSKVKLGVDKKTGEKVAIKVRSDSAPTSTPEFARRAQHASSHSSQRTRTHMRS